ncbi:MAG TPA: leucine-rich repeat domain-containing protein [Pseudomonadales bacterium]|nr:leucine-rich repeat domain-containing protein [Pseudomonadales bacterium]
MNQKSWPIKLLFLLVLLLGPVMAHAQFTYVTNDDDTITITGYTGPDNNIVIPDEIGGMSVSSIGGNAFYNSTVKSVVIPDSVTSIQDFAFESCANLANITIGNGLTSINTGAFEDCASLTNILIPDSITNISQIAFYGCISLSAITIPASVTYIENDTFLYCTSLTNVIISNGVVGIGQAAFEFCSGLVNFSIPASVTNIAPEVFDGCSELTMIAVDPGNEFYSSISGVLCDKSQTLLIRCPQGRSGSYTVPVDIANIGGSAFFECSCLTNVVIPANVTTIGDAAFYLCTNLTSITIGNGVTNFGIYAFEDCYSLASVSIPNSVTSLPSYLFFGCTGLTNVAIPNSVTNIGSAAFLECISLSTINIPNSVTYIGTQAFEECGLSSLIIPNSVVGIDEAAFAECKSLTNVFVESTAPFTAGEEFEYCFKLKQIFFSGNAPPFDGDSTVFYSDTNATVYYLPGMHGWAPMLDGRPTAPWYLSNPSILTFEPTFGIQTNAFGFTISWATNIPVIVDACTNLSRPDWQPVQTNTLTAGTAYFSDSQWASYSARFYRLRSP